MSATEQQKPVVTIKELAAIVGMSKRILQNNYRRLGLDRCELRINKRLVYFFREQAVSSVLKRR